MSAPAYRFGPRQGGRSSSRIDWERVGRIALVIVFIAVLLSYVRPALGLYGSWHESREQSHKLAELKRENKDLQLQAQYLSGSSAAEHAARERGMVASGEAPYRVELSR